MKVTGGPTGPAPSRVPNHEQQIQTALMQTPKDQKGLQHQHQQLQQLFKSLSPAEAQHLQAQLQANKKGDAMAANFHKLPAATQKDLNGILAKHHAPPQHVQPHAHEPAVTGHKVAGRGSATQQVGALVAKGQFAKQQAPAAPAAQQKSTFGSFVNKFLNPPAHQPGVYQAPTPSKPTFIEKGKKPIFEGRSKGTTTTKSPDGKTETKTKAIGPGSLTPYGTGTTLSGKEVYVAKAGELNWSKDLGKAGSVAAGGDTKFLQARGRTYTTGTSIGAEGQAAVINANYGIRYDAPSATLNGQHIAGFHADASGEAFVGAEGRAYAGVSLGKDKLPQINVGAEAFAGARTTVKAGVTGDVMGIEGTAGGSAGAMAGASGTATASLGKSGLQAEAGGFAGASASAKGSATIAGVGVSGKAEAWAGIGAKASATATFKDGKLRIGTELGAALGIGGSVSWGVEIDVGKAVKNVAQFGKTTYNLIKAPAQKVVNTLTKGSVAVAKQVGKTAVQVANTVAKGVTSTVKTVGKAVTTAAKTVGTAVSSAAHTVGNAVSSAAKSVAKAFSSW